MAVRSRSIPLADNSGDGGDVSVGAGGEVTWTSVVDAEDCRLSVDLEPYNLNHVEAAVSAFAPATGWTRTFGAGAPKLVANGPFPHNTKKAKRSTKAQAETPSPNAKKRKGIAKAKTSSGETQKFLESPGI